jgi:hypothetical protein
MRVEDTKPGDILFFGPKVQDGDFTKFDQLAAAVQGMPYGGDRPWHHASVATQGAKPVVGFGQTGDPDADGRYWDPFVAAHRWDTTSDYSIVALRPPHGGDDVARAAEAMVGKTSYAIPGLLAFAAAMQARMFADGPVRERMFAFAAGAEAEARRKDPGGETCVTAVVAALERAGFRLTFTEPPPPVASSDPELRAVIDEVFARLRKGAGDRGPTSVLLDPGEVAAGWRGGDGHTRNIVDQVLAPGLVETTTGYVNLLAGVITGQFDGVSSDQLVRHGQELRRKGGGTPAWTISPAMLYDALVAADFSVVE